MEPTVKTLDELGTQEFPWGSITWLVNGAIGNSETLTVGRVVIKKGCRNGEHRHGNCDEVLHLLQGELEHTGAPDGGTFHMKAGDTISLPAGMKHYATSVGTEDAVMIVCYSSAWREMQGE
jgi:quercetin dioxygenase-like cupin family protein